ncbi:molybdopterin-containing oxidoreductase family protein [Burkholderia vietnamiensis]|uniref:molybdopterin-containing oxidoreductase family protein n=1 Tax=Burkholderia vietnamiensis TaxID=60552 RepID=UPI001CF44E00|nr:molybdopterin oxidoreductase family protein [Burkholderia vietnamiensis]MCA8231732.1 molybdopterin oxidoreductase family protein [Burkholderia vietnamiensis]MCA8270880.1 molybdopterin oxidoreductase family protein [Burkholderia vietnamiensis]MCA8452035.1 molybdopterin oxidoreductase family protein [Burkholderia vietnamiensis]UKV76210.1 molybdopterin oxidoreductase family protein [Burkholderia vietnamiensis]HDR8929488.1 molybdopterin oxidoreductase family protein [Burkholderia vietnamiensis]
MNGATQIARAVCPHDCPDTCAMRVTVENGKAIKVTGDPEHPPTQGVLCTKVSRYADRVHHPDRLTVPLKRIGAKGEGRFAPITWNEAFDEIGRRLGDIAARSPESILPYSYAGTMGLVQGEGIAQRFFHKIGASRLERTICAAAGAAGLRYTYGGNIGMHLEHFEESELILIWGANPIASSLHFWTRAQEAKRRGARLVAIDPYRSLTAEKCHQHIALKPGTDGAFALGMMNVLITENLLDHDYIARHTVGFEALKARALSYPPERVAQICGIDASELIELARRYGATRKASIRLNYGMQRVRGGGNAVRAIASLPALTGAWRDRAGGLLLSSSEFAPIDHAALLRPDLIPGWPHKLPRIINMNAIGDALLHPGDDAFGPKVEAVIVYNSNPVAVAPDSSKVAAGFAREDLFTVVLEHFQTDTVDFADIVLPATTQLEHLDIHKSYGHTYVMANLPAIPPVGEARPNTEIFRGIARSMGLDEPALYHSDEEVAQTALRWDDPTLDSDWNTLKHAGWVKLKLADAPFANGGFRTPSGKCEFHSARLEQMGLDPVPDYLPPYESAEASPELAARYPLAMISPPARHFLNSTFVNVESLRSTEGEPHLDIHPADAESRGIGDGGMVRIFNDRGSMQAVARVTDRARAGLVVGLSIWWKKLSADGRNANEVTSQALTDLGNSATFYDCLVEVERI